MRVTNEIAGTLEVPSAKSSNTFKSKLVKDPYPKQKNTILPTTLLDMSSILIL